jgi:hypothetical protein
MVNLVEPIDPMQLVCGYSEATENTGEQKGEPQFKTPADGSGEPHS